MSKNTKHILHLPKTSFPMRAGLKEKEPQLIQFWKDNSIYQKLLHKRQKQKCFTLIDGPPYANGKLHIGHALNKILKDITVKYKNLSGYLAPFNPIWDCHGLPIEVAVLKKIKNAGQKTDDFIRKMCREEAKKWVAVQKKQFESLGVLADWNHPLLTLDSEYEAEEVRALAKVVDSHLLYRGKKPVYWCSTLKTAIANSEVEYSLHKSPSIYVRFPAPTIPSFFNLSSNKACYFIIWTTTPWTLPANIAICLKPDLQYGVFDSGSELLILAHSLKEKIQKKLKISLTKIHTFLGSQLEKQKAKHPWLAKDSLIILGDHVSAEEGTGCVHTAPGHGQDDFTVGMKYHLPVFAPVDTAGRFTKEVPEWEGLSVFEANAKIISKLKEENKLLSATEITHNYPFNPRSNTPLILRAVEQWFIALDHSEYSVRDKALKAIHEQVQFFPTWGKRRLESMIKNSPDWCLSRQRHWGVPIPVFYCTQCNWPLLDSNIMRSIADQMEITEEGIDYWFSHSEEQLLPSPIPRCQKCQNNQWIKGKDILDVWFDSGICHFIYQKKYGNKTFPADVYLEGSDQHRGWFQTSLNSSICLHGQSPFKNLITHCFINDVTGHKMSKSKGNVLDLNNLLTQKGADIIRLWVSSEDYSQDFQLSTEILDRVTETYRRFRNTFRFMLGNLFDFVPQQHLVDFSHMRAIDQWILAEFAKCIAQVQSYYDKFLYYKIYQTVNVFFTNSLSSLYLDILKDRLYTFKANSSDRRSAQSIIYLLTKDLAILISPILTFLSEEVYQHLPGDKEQSVLLNDFPSSDPRWIDPEREKKFETWLNIRKIAYAQMEKMRKEKQIGSSLETQVLIEAPKKLLQRIKDFQKDLKECFIVSELSIQEADQLRVTVQKASGEKCERCWHYSVQLNNEKICLKCLENLV